MTDEEKLAAVEEVYRNMRSIADHSAFIKRDPYDFTEALREALGLPEEESELY